MGIVFASPFIAIYLRDKKDAEDKKKFDIGLDKGGHYTPNSYFFIQHFLYFFPLPHGQGSFLPIFGSSLTNGSKSVSSS